MTEPPARRPHMPDYGILEAAGGTGLLPWSWARERLEYSQHYWVASTWPDGRPHVAPVWGIFTDRALVFSCARASRKARNLLTDPRCVVATEDPLEPVVLDGRATALDDRAAIGDFAAAINAKHEVEYPVDFYTSPTNICFRVDGETAIGLVEADFTGSPTRWELR